MIHIKKYNEDLSDKGWESITHIEWNDLLTKYRDECPDMTQDEIYKIQTSGQPILLKLNNNRAKNVLYVSDVYNKQLVIICKLPDEWYAVMYYDDHYKCDQFDGLLNLLGHLA
jgi:hypothetical protein